MAKTREIPCIHYICAHSCALGKDAEFYKLCQTCPSYKKRPGYKPARLNLKRKKLDEIRRKEKY